MYVVSYPAPGPSVRPRDYDVFILSDMHKIKRIPSVPGGEVGVLSCLALEEHVSDMSLNRQT